jgi:hypothetical protein
MRDSLGAHMFPGLAGFIIGTLAAQIVGASVYRRLVAVSQPKRLAAPIRALLTGLVTGVVATAVYIPLHVQEWISGNSDWRVSAFLGLCIGTCQALLFKDRPRLRPARSQSKVGA